MDRGSSPDRPVRRGSLTPKAETPTLPLSIKIGFVLAAAGIVCWIVTGDWRPAAVGGVLLMLSAVFA